MPLLTCSYSTNNTSMGDPPVFYSGLDDSTSAGSWKIVWPPTTASPWPGTADNTVWPYNPADPLGVLEVVPVVPERLEALERRVQELEKKLADKQEATPAAPTEKQEPPAEEQKELPESGVDVERFKKL